MLEGYRQENGLVYFKIPTGTNLITPNGVVYGSYNSEIVVDEANLDKVRQFNDITVTVGYFDVQNDTEISVEEYERKKFDLIQKSKGQDDDGEFLFANIEDEVNWLVFSRTHRLITESKTHTWPFEYIIKGDAPESIPYIQPIRKVTGDLTNTLYRYSRASHAAELVSEFLTKNGFHSVPHDPTKDGQFYIKDQNLEFSKIRYPGGKHSYLTIEIPGLKQFEKSSITTGTKDELVVIRDQTEKIVLLEMSAWLNRSSPLSQATLGQVVSQLKTIQSAMAEMEVKVKSADTKRKTVRAIEQLLTMVKSSIT